MWWIFEWCPLVYIHRADGGGVRKGLMYLTEYLYTHIVYAILASPKIHTHTYISAKEKNIQCEKSVSDGETVYGACFV